MSHRIATLCIECHAESRYAECLYAEYLYAECLHAECHYAVCHYDECRGTVKVTVTIPNYSLLQPQIQ